MKIVFDLDGTLIDSSDRMYNLFVQLVGDSRLSKDDYWNYKRDKHTNQELIREHYTTISYNDFLLQWMEKIEEYEYLKLDTKYQDTIEVLDKLGNFYSMILLTARQSEERLVHQLKEIGLLGYFDVVLTTKGIRSKESVWEDYKSSCMNEESFVYVTDMGKDIVFGRNVGFITVAISHGFMNKNRLLEYKPDYIINDLTDLIEVIDKIEAIHS